MSVQAEAIADAILNGSVLGPATRVALRAGIDAGCERNLGGLNRTALIRIIDEALIAYATDAPALAKSMPATKE